MKIYLAADHNGYHLKGDVRSYLQQQGYEVEDVGDRRLNQDDDYPVFASRAVATMLGSDDKDSRAVLICGSGQGMCIAANRFKGVRAALGYNQRTVREARNDDDSNVLCLPAESLRSTEAYRIIDAWLETDFANAARYVRRNKQLDELT